MNVICSKDNSKIKYVRSLNSRKNRCEDFTVEGIKFVREAVIEKAEIKYILIGVHSSEKAEFLDIIELLNSSCIEYFLCEDSIFDSVAETVNAQGILAVVSKHSYDREKILLEHKFIVMCDRIQDPGNLGTIIRTSDAFGPTAVILNKGCVDVYNSKVVRAAAGALFRVPFITGDTTEDIINYLKSAGYMIIATVVDSELSFENLSPADKICVVIGNEGQGVSNQIIDASDSNITIRMSGRAESLNASIAAGISIYEIRKKLL